MANAIETIAVQEFMKSNNFVSVVKMVRSNTNQYLYVTFITADNKAENVYFSKNAAEMTAKGEIIARGFFTPFMIGFTTNANGEKRTKLIAQGESNRITAEDLF